MMLSIFTEGMVCLGKIIVFSICFLITKNLQGVCDAKLYNQSNQSQFEHAIKEVPKLNLSGDEKILDIGAGDGLLSSYITKAFLEKGELIGIDSSEEMVKFAISENTNPKVITHRQCRWLRRL